MTASKVTIASVISHRFRNVGVNTAKKMQVLGVGTSAGRGGLHGGQRKRLNAIEKRALRLKRLKQIGARVRSISQIEIALGTSYGAKVIGMTVSVLHQLRWTMVLALPNRAKSASVSLQYLSSDKP